MPRRAFPAGAGQGVDGVLEGEAVDALQDGDRRGVRIAAASAIRVSTDGPVSGRSARSRVMIPAMTTTPAANWPR